MASSKKIITYKDAGVDIAAGEALVDQAPEAGADGQPWLRKSSRWPNLPEGQALTAIWVALAGFLT